MTQKTLSRTINLPAAVFLIIGYVIGATIFILPGSLAAMAGPAIYIAYLMAAVPALFACFVMAVIGSAIPASGSIYLVIRDALSPMLGFLYIWLMVAMAALVTPLVAMGFADYFSHFYSALESRTVTIIVISLIIVINYLGMKVASGFQNLLVIGFILALLIFSIGGLTQADPALMKPLFPRGLSPIVVAATTAYFSYAGIFIIAEVAGEIKNPGRTIPLAIFLSFIVIILLYTLVPLALTGILNWETIGSTRMSVVAASQKFMPDWLVTFIAVGALLAAATSVNGIVMGLSRDFYKGAKSGLFPRYFAAIHPRFKTPGRAVLVIGALSLAGVFAGRGIVQYAQIAVMELMVIQIMTGVALLRLPGKMPEVYEGTPFKLSKIALRIICICYIGFSAIFLIVLGMEQPEAVSYGLIFIAVGCAWYFFTAQKSGAQDA
jgi:APA family basic amino acid/polyamine antiporter